MRGTSTSHSSAARAPHFSANFLCAFAPLRESYPQHPLPRTRRSAPCMSLESFVGAAFRGRPSRQILYPRHSLDSKQRVATEGRPYKRVFHHLPRLRGLLTKQQLTVSCKSTPRARPRAIRRLPTCVRSKTTASP